MSKCLNGRAVARTLTVCSLLGLLGLGLWLAGMHVLVEYHLRQARQALARQRYQGAVGELDKALGFRPGSAELHLLAGRIARQAGNFPVAREHLFRCRNLQKGVSADLQLEEYLLRAQSGEVEEVYRYLAPYLYQEGPQTPLVLEALSHVYLFIYRFDLAWPCLQRWLLLRPDNVEALYLRGMYYSLKLDADSAVADLRRVLELDPERLPARLLLAQTFKDNNHPMDATAEYKVVLQQDPENFAGRLGMATYYVDMKQWAEARPLLEALSREQRDSADVLYLRARVEEGEGRVEEAARLLEEALAANPGDRSACYHLILYAQRRDDEAAAQKYQALLDRIEKDQKRLLEITNTAMDVSSSSPAACCELGEICLRLGIIRRGLHWLHAALRLDPRYRPAHEQLLRYYERLGPAGEKDALFHRQQLDRPSSPSSAGDG